MRFADQRYSYLLMPISSDAMWLIEQRNRVNYKMYDSLELYNSFVASFSRRLFPNSLPRELNTQYSVCEGLLQLGLTFATQFQLSTDALDGTGPKVSFGDTVKRGVYWPVAPKLISHTLSGQMFGV